LNWPWHEGTLMLEWLRAYRRDQLAGDLSAGIIVALMTVPQGMAYALVAGLPPVAGLYASIAPPLIYALFGTSMTQAVGPAAIASLMTAAALAPLAATGSSLYGVLAAQLALMAGMVLLACSLLRLGFLANFFSRPVMSGFTIGSAIVIALGQLPALTGGAPLRPHGPSLALGLACLATLLVLRKALPLLLRRCGLAPGMAAMGARLSPLLVVVGATLALLFLPGHGIRLTGEVPSGLPALNIAISTIHADALLKPALLIGFMIFLTSMSAAQALALRRQEKLNSNRELLALGAANVGSALSLGFPVTGSLSRSAVNFAAGAQTPLAGVISSLLLAAALLAPTGWLAWLPLPALAATIIVAVAGMIDLSTLRAAWRYDRADALALLATAGGVLFIGVEAGVIIGVVLSMGTLILRASRPQVAVLGRIPGSEHFRNIERHEALTRPQILMLRIDANLFFGNAESVSERIEEELAERPQARELVLVMTAVSAIDTSALFALGELNAVLRQRGIRLHLAEVKGPVIDRLKASELPEQLSGQIFLSAAMAEETLLQTKEEGTERNS
jgi:SulP family sulfate permease